MTWGRDAKLFVSLFSLSVLITYGTALLFGSPEFGYDGWQYISSGKSLLTGTMPENYFWVRQPLWPMLLAIPLYFGANIWLVVLLSCVLISLGWAAFVVTVRCHIAPKLSKKLFWPAVIIPAIGLWVYLGGYVMTPLQQSALICYLLLLSSLAIVTYSFDYSSGSRIKPIAFAVAWLAMTTAGYLLTSVYGLIAFGSAIVIAVLRISEGRVRSRKTLSSALITAGIILGSLLGLVGSHIIWSSVVSEATRSPQFNEDNNLDPFWEIDYLGNIKERVYQRTTYYAQEVFVSITSLLDVTQSRGWRGIDNNPFRDDEVNINFAIGSRPFTAVAPICAESLPWEYVQAGPGAMPTRAKILTVEPDYVIGFKDSPQCKLTSYTLPQWFSLSGWILWIFLLGAAIVGMIRTPSRLRFALLTPPLLLILAYGITGGAIARYGIPAYYPIALIGALTLAEFLARQYKTGRSANPDPVEKSLSLENDGTHD